MITKFKTKNRILSLLLTLVLVAGVIPITHLTAYGATSAPTGVWTDYASQSFSGGNGTAQNPYEIATANDLARVAAEVNSGNPNRSLSGKHFIFTANIDLSAHRWEPICYMIGASGRSFAGAYFDGNHKTIRGLYVDESRTEDSHAGLFGVLEIALVKDLTIENAYIKANGDSSCAGVLAGSSTQQSGSVAPQIENCHVSGTVEGTCSVGGMIGQASYTTIKNCTSDCDVTGGWAVGGFVGYPFISDIQKCVSKAVISAWNWNTGGFVGYNLGSTITNCAALGTLNNTVENVDWHSKAGGFVGTNTSNGEIRNCYTTVKVTISNAISNPGGFIGYADSNDNTAKAENCLFDAEKNVGVSAIGNIGDDYTGINTINKDMVTNNIANKICKECYGNTDHKYSNGKTCLDCEYKFTLWTDEGNYDISWYTGHENDNNYYLEDAADLAGLAVLVNGLNGHTAVKFQMKNIPNGKTITINKDIDLDGKMWTPIGTSENPFLATFFGNDKTIKNMTVGSDESYVGLFGKVGAHASIRNLKVTNSSVETVGNVNYVGGIVGSFENGTLRDCFYDGTVFAEGQFVGGVIGQSNKTHVTNCVNYATVTATGTQARQVGGVIGDSMGWVENCANFGTVTGYSSVGGVVGKVSYGTLKNCYNVGVVSATNTDEIAGAIVGYVLPPSYGVTSINNCYFLEGSATEALGSAKEEFKTTMYSASKNDFTSGKVTYLLNGQDAGTNFYQNLDDDKTVDEYPLPDSSHGKVYHYTVYTKCDKSDANPVVKYTNSAKNDEVPTHIYQYNASGNVITETCKNCESHTETATIVISSTDEFIYSGDAHTPATVDYSDGWQGGELECFYKNNTNVGTNSATVYIKVGDEEATLAFSIKKADNIWETTPAISDWTYGENAHEPSYKAKFGTVKVTYTGTANDGSSYSSDDAPVKAGSYKVTFKVEGTDNYGKLEKSVNFVINKADQSAPIGLTEIAETIDGKADGEITNVTSAMEYRKEDDTDYIAIIGTKITDLADGKYDVRYKADDNHNASADTKITIDTGRKLTVTVPITQVGYAMKVNKTTLVWNDSVELTFTLADGYSKLNNFAVKLNGNPIALDTDGKYTVTDIQSDLTVTITGVADLTAPDAEITLGTNKWNNFFSSITFGLFFKETQKVTITADDTGSGVDKVYYYLSTTELTEAQVQALTDGDWKEYTGEFNLNPQDEYIIYAKAIDKANNAKYISSDKTIMIDNIAPVISGIADGETHYGDTTFEVTDKYLKEIKVDGNPVTLVDGKYTITAEGKEHTVVATDKAGNSTTIKIKVLAIDSLDDSIKGITIDNVKSSDKKAIEDLQNLVNVLISSGKTFTETEQTKLNEIKANIETLLKKIDAVDKNEEATNSPSTGDNVNIRMWFAFVLLSGGLLGMTTYRRKKKYSAE